MKQASLWKEQGKPVILENPQEIFDRLKRTTVSEVTEMLIAEAIDDYALQEIKNEADREKFFDKYSNEHYAPLIRNAVLEAVVAVVAAYTVHLDYTFNCIVEMLACDESEKVIRDMKLILLRRMAADATDDMGDQSEEEIFMRRIALAEMAMNSCPIIPRSHSLF